VPRGTGKHWWAIVSYVRFPTEFSALDNVETAAEQCRNKSPALSAATLMEGGKMAAATVRLTFGLLLTTALAGSAMAPAGGADAGTPPGIAELLDPAAIARHLCGSVAKRRTEGFKPGV
jgi:hypothetical protein